MCFLNRNKFANEGVINRTTLSFVGIKSTLKLAFFMWHYCRRIMVKCTHTPDLTHSQHTHTLTQTHTHTLSHKRTHTPLSDAFADHCAPLWGNHGQPPGYQRTKRSPVHRGSFYKSRLFSTLWKTLYWTIYWIQS